MAKLTAAQRKKLPAKDFAGPGRSYPVNDPNHAKAALSMGAKYAPPAVQSKIKSKVASRFPGIAVGGQLSDLANGG